MRVRVRIVRQTIQLTAPNFPRPRWHTHKHIGHPHPSKPLFGNEKILFCKEVQNWIMQSRFGGSMVLCTTGLASNTLKTQLGGSRSVQKNTSATWWKLGAAICFRRISDNHWIMKQSVSNPVYSNNMLISTLTGMYWCRGHCKWSPISQQEGCLIQMLR
jgi:hypothetical protein